MTIYKFSSGELDDSKTPLGQLNDKKLTNADWAMITKYLNDHDDITVLNLSKNHLTNLDRDFVNAVKAHPKLIKINCDNNSLNMRTGTGSYIDNLRRPETHLNPKDVEELNNFLQQRITDAINGAKDQLPHVLSVVENFKNNISTDFRFENQLVQISRLIEVLQRIPVAQLKDDPDTSHLKGFMESDQYRIFSTFITVINNLHNIDSGKKREQSLADIDKILSSSSFINSVNIYQAIYNRFQHYLSNPNQASVEQILFLLQLAGRYLEKSTDIDIMRINDQIMSLATKLLNTKVAEVENACNVLLRNLSDVTSYITLLQLYDTYAVLLNHETELANLLNNTRDKLFDRSDISLDTYVKIVAKLSNTNDSFPKETVSLSIAHSKLTGPAQAALLRELSSIMRPDEKKQPAYIAAEKKITNKLYQEGIEAYLAAKHDKDNKKRAQTLLEIIEDKKKSSFDRDMDILSILSSSKYAKLKALLINAAIVEYGFNHDRFKKLSEKEQLRSVEAAILQKNDIVKTIVNNKPVLLKIDSQALFREWHAIARLVARYTLAKDFVKLANDFVDPENYMHLTTAIREAKDLITLHKALDQLKERCRAESPITEALSKIIDGVRNYRSPTNESTEIFEKIVKIRKDDVEKPLKSSSAALFSPTYTSKQEKEEVNEAEYQLNRKLSSSKGSRG